MEPGATSLPACSNVAGASRTNRLAHFFASFADKPFLWAGAAVPVIFVLVPFSPKDRMLLEAANGWLMLGNAAEALAEFGQLSPAAREKPEALVTLWEIHAQARRWDEAIAAADRLIQKAKDQPDGYIKRAYALHELRRSQEAWETLHPVSNRFADNWLIPYNLACYAAQLGRPDDALKWFRKAVRVGDERELRNMALNDPDLEPIRQKIEKSLN